MRGTLHFIFIDVADRQTMDKNLAGVIAELMPKPPREGVRPPRADVVVEGITTTQTQVCVLVRIVVP